MKKYLFLVLVVLFLALPFLVKASVLSEPLVQCGRTGQGQAACTLCDVFKLVQRIINFISYGLFILAPIFIVYGGIMILLAGAKPSNVETGKNIIKNAIIGVIIALLAWTVINTLFNTLVSEDKSKFPGPWNTIQCTGGGVTPGDGGTTPTEGEYCACEAPRYSIKPDTIGTDIRVTQLANKDTCKTGCVIANANTYCPSSNLTPSDYKIYCTNKTTVESKEVCQMTVNDVNYGVGCRIGTACYDSDNACMDASVGQYLSKCNLDNESFCNSKIAKNNTTFCLTGFQKNLCNNSADKYVLYQWRAESVIGKYNALQCSMSAYKNNDYCRLNCQYETCTSTQTGTCKGNTCSDSNLNICGQIASDCSLLGVGQWNSKIDAAAKGRTKICPTVDSVRMVKAIMARESGGNISAKSGAGAGGLMQLLPSTANQYKSQCGVSENIDLNWLTNSANAEEQICIAIEYMKSLVGSCSCSVKNIAAGYNGGGGKTGACDPSTNCGSAAKADGGECLACTGEQFTRRWQCLWDDNTHTKCNVDNPGGSFSETRKYAPMVDYCYDQFR